MKNNNHTFENTMIYLIDLPALSKSICNELFEGKDYVIKGFSGMIREPKTCLVHTEIVAILVSKDKGTLHIDLYEPNKEKVNEDGKKVTSISMFPKAACEITPDEIYPYLMPDPITLAEFTKERRGYNGRLQSNERQLVKWLNEKETVAATNPG